jgi:hypothetical protein
MSDLHTGYTRLGLCRTLDCVFDVYFDLGDEDWVAFKVCRDGNMIVLGRFVSEKEAEDFAAAEHQRQLADRAANSAQGA